MTHAPEDPFLEIDVKGGESSHQSLIRSKGERHPMGEKDFLVFPDAWYSKRREKPHVFKRGKTC